MSSESPSDCDPTRQQSGLLHRARRLVGRGVHADADAEDLPQSTLREAWERRDRQSFEHPGRLRAWLAKVMHHKAVRAHRKSERTEPGSEAIEALTARESSPSSAI